MTPNFKLRYGTYSVLQFPSGELQIKLNLDSNTDISSSRHITIIGSILSSGNLIELLQLKEAIDYYYKNPRVTLIMPYCAYSHQDRRCNPGESLSSKVFTNIINSCNFSTVTTYDNHSEVSTALIDNCLNVSVHDILFGAWSKQIPNIKLGQYNFLVSPDAGANKKVFECSSKFNIPMIRADKHRDTKTGNITSTEVYATAEQLNNKTVLIVDDICASGRTFEELAKAIKLTQPSCTIHLYITHGFFHKGLHKLSLHIDKFITTDSVCQIEDKDLTIVKLQRK